jgi:hypothetical protein
MTSATAVRAVPSLAAGILLSLMGGASAQIAGCRLGPTPDGRQVLRCGDFNAVLEPGADVRAVDANRDGAPDALQLANRGVLVDYEAPGRRGFQILTPHAIAAVRGTTWVVSVEGGRTSVFVVGGQVTVTRAAAGHRVLLRAGEGVDVDGGGSGPLRVASWPRERVAALLARFGRR